MTLKSLVKCTCNSKLMIFGWADHSYHKKMVGEMWLCKSRLIWRNVQNKIWNPKRKEYYPIGWNQLKTDNVGLYNLLKIEGGLDIWYFIWDVECEKWQNGILRIPSFSSSMPPLLEVGNNNNSLTRFRKSYKEYLHIQKYG